MFKLIKYELMGRYKLLLGGIIALSLINIYIMYKVQVTPYSPNDAVQLGLIFLAGFAFLVGIVISGISICRRDIFGETGYLIFALPVKGYAIVGAKLLVTLIECVIFTLVTVVFEIISLLNTGFNIPWDIVWSALNKSKGDIALILIYLLLSAIIFLLIVHFSLALSKTALGNKKFGRLAAFIIFILSYYIIGKIGMFLVTWFPYKNNVFNFQNESNLFIKLGSLNVALLVFNLIIAAAFFIATSYLLEKKIDV